RRPRRNGAQPCEAAARAAQALMRAAPARADEVRRTAELALREGDPVLAADLIETLPPDQAPLSLRVRALVAAGRPERAEAALAAEEPADAPGLTEHARLHLLAGRPDRAEELADLALALRDTPRTRLVAGRAALAQGRFLEAAEHLARIPPGTSVAPEARTALAQALRAQALPHLADEVETTPPPR
ncbi:MAG: hypothetical protein ACODAU_07850, partial [Myxococcota bacterium]